MFVRLGVFQDRNRHALGKFFAKQTVKFRLDSPDCILCLLSAIQVPPFMQVAVKQFQRRGKGDIL